MKDIIKISDISELHNNLGYNKPLHPLITILDASKIIPTDAMLSYRIVFELYSISLKYGINGFKYGRKTYDFQEGCLVFTEPGQIIEIQEIGSPNEYGGWILFFHSDLLKGSNLAKEINNYTFFSYDVNEALHLSEKEKN
ncbi:MAG: AraC family transcriptional regulator, partial [Spirochaetes bacterium]|nr:AraC family transcriptional regulator [Spirochaetota bacterium]